MKSKILTCLLLTTALLTLAACGGAGTGNFASGASGTGSTASAHDQDIITIKGISDEDITITVGEIKELETVTQKAEATRSNGQKVSVKATGPLLDTVLQKYGADKSDYNTIRFTASDGYSIAMPSSIIEKDDIILSYEDGGKILSDEDGPIRVVVPGERAMYWVRMLSTIDFESDSGAQTAEKLVFLDTAQSELQSQTIDVQGSAVECISISDMIAAFANIDDNSVQNVYMSATDGLSKNETKDSFLAQYLRISGENAPEYTGPELQEGMTIKGLLTINYGNTAFFSVQSGLQSMGLVSGNQGNGLSFSSVIQKIGSMPTDTYRITTTNGNSKEYSADDLGTAIIYMNNGKVSFSSTDDAFGDTLDGIVSIEAVQK